jgi:hypothetical protein
MNRFKQTFATRKPVGRFAAIGLVTALSLVSEPATAQRIPPLPPPPNNPPVNIIVVTPPPAAPVITGRVVDVPVQTTTTTTTTTTTAVTPLGWYLMGGIFCAAASPIVGTIMLNREMLPGEVLTSTLTCFLGPVGWVIAQQMLPPDGAVAPVTQPLPPSTPSPGGEHHATDRGSRNNANRSGFTGPARGSLFVLNEIVVSTEGGTTTDEVDAFAGCGSRGSNRSSRS